ncbi:hypothetical protein EGI11_07265 [Chryseobacterium sp. H3056]|uniref:T9SS C-terminal target domain-containing protein n=1 Tax=Kaistella daneshvariae TaxID=2487074 RepID=A0A3N0WW43_9FLAO|nr:hypothetical protein [Kaistella daneshvariae]ROI09203.1 hypothetical protein EGI11_07265 [Kaistella daneshvariae]
MNRFLSRNLFSFLLSLGVLSTYLVNAQKNVFKEDFNTAVSSAFTSSGSIGSSRWSVTRSGGDMGARINGGIMTLTNDASSALNVNGWVMASTSASNFDALYKPILSQNVGTVSWTFNMRQIRTDPSGFEKKLYGVAFILAGTSTSNLAGNGYAVILGESTKTDRIRLVSYSGGIQGTLTTKIASNTIGLSDFGSEYASIRVDYNPANNSWTLFVRKDNSTSFADPQAGTLVSQGSVVSSEFINTSLPVLGTYWKTDTQNGQTAFFDNISVDVSVPELSSLSPDSKVSGSGAVSLIVTGEGFLPTGKVYWDGSLRATTYNSPTQLTASIPATDLPSDFTQDVIRQVTVANGTFVSNALPFTIERAEAPSLTVSTTSLPAFSTVTGSPSSTGSYTITGQNLNGPVTITAPPNFEISSDGTTYSTSLSLLNTGTTLNNGQPVTVRVRLAANAASGKYSSSIAHSTLNAVSKTVAVSGRVLASEPTLAATNASFSNVTSTGFKLLWTNGNGAQRLVLIKESNAVNSVPADGTSYSANPVFPTGSQIGTENFVVFKGIENSVQVTGLSPNKTYYVSIFEFNGQNGTENYRPNGTTDNTSTPNTPAGLQLKTSNTSFKINFDETVDGVNAGAFQGTGISDNKVTNNVNTSNPIEAGQLDSNAWSFTGFSGVSTGFGVKSTADGSAENGVSDGAEVNSGIYAFNVGTSDTPNYTFGVQPGGGDFNPGSITLRVQNQTGAPLTSLNIGYKVYIYNDQAASSTIRFSSSSIENGPFTDQVTVDVASPAAADGASAWKAYYRVVTITGLNITNSGYYYLRWSFSPTQTATQDEFAIDDIEVIANPSTVTATFDGIAEDFILQGNAGLAGNLSVQTRLQFNGGKLALKDKILTIAGAVENISSGGLTGGTDGKLVIRGIRNPILSFDQTNLNQTNILGSLTITGASANKVTAANNFGVNNLLQVDELQTLDLADIQLFGDLAKIENNGLITTKNTSDLPFPKDKSWTGTGILHLNAGTAAQKLVPGTYTNLTLSSAGGTIATGNVTVNGILHLPSGNPSPTAGSLSMGTYTLLMGGDGTNTGIGEVSGLITRNSFTTSKLYTFGHPNSSIIFPIGGTLPTTMSAKLTLGVAPAWRPSAIKRYYDITQIGANSTKAIIRQHYLDSELNTNNVESKLVFWTHKVDENSTFEQGKSNNSSTDNYVEIANANIAEYLVATAGKVFITLDNSADALVATWTGATSESWITATNWKDGTIPGSNTKVIIPVVSTGNSYPTLPPLTGDLSTTIGSLTIEAGAKVNSSDTSKLLLNNGAGAWQNSGTFNPGTGTVIFTNPDATISGSTNFYNLTVEANARLRALEGNYMSIEGTLANNGLLYTSLLPNTVEFKGKNQIIPATTQNLTDPTVGGYHHLIISGTNANFAAETVNIRGNLSLGETVNINGKNLNFLGASDQTLSRVSSVSLEAPTIQLNNLSLNKTGGTVKLTKDVTVDGFLTLNSGLLNIGDQNLTLKNKVQGTSFGETNMIIAHGAGFVKASLNNIGSYTFPIGEYTDAPSYSPITVNVTSGTITSPALIGVSVKNLKHPNNSSAQNFLRKYWNVQQSGITSAVADITATYEPIDVQGTESNIDAAQLIGAFDAVDNPWKKFGKIGTNILTATGATLVSDNTSIFTGVTAEELSVEVFGHGSFCLGSEAKLEAVVKGGTAPYTYQWSDSLPGTATVTVPTATAGTVDYKLTVRDANGFIATDNSIPVTVLAASVGGTITPAEQQICGSSFIADLILQGSVGTVLHWQKSTDPNFITFENIPNFTTTLTAGEIGILTETTYFRAVLQSGSCTESYSVVAVIRLNSTTWNGTKWSNGDPNATTSAIFAGNYSTGANISACSIVVKDGAVVLIPAGFDVSLSGKITVEKGGKFTLASNSNLFQETNVQNLGEISVQRESSALYRLDYTMWGSPVTGTQTLQQFSPQTLSNRFYTYNSASDVFSLIEPTLNNFKTGQGYLIRIPNNHVLYGANVTAKTWTGTFTGVPNNGDILVNLNAAGNGYNMISNPYPSEINADKFLAENASEIGGTIYFWRRRNDTPDTSAYYATYSKAGGVASASSPQKPNGFIQVGQGFIVKKNAGSTGQLKFTKGMRESSADNQFFKMTAGNKSRIWLNVTNTAGDFGQMLIAYMDGAENGVDRSDGKYFGDGSTALTSWLENAEYIIQGRAPFTAQDVVPLNFKTARAGTFTISIDHVDGLFKDNQDIYLRDKLASSLQNLKKAAYVFDTEAGSFNSRFEIVYQTNSLAVNDGLSAKNEVMIYKKDGEVIVTSKSKKLNEVSVVDFAGRLLMNEENIRANSISLKLSNVNQVLILKITLEDGTIVTRKLIN